MNYIVDVPNATKLYTLTTEPPKYMKQEPTGLKAKIVIVIVGVFSLPLSIIGTTSRKKDRGKRN